MMHRRVRVPFPYRATLPELPHPLALGRGSLACQVDFGQATLSAPTVYGGRSEDCQGEWEMAWVVSLVDDHP